MSLKRGIEAAVERVSEELSKLAKDVETKEQIASTASISAGDTAIGEMIAEAMDKVGKEGVITVEESNASASKLSSPRACVSRRVTFHYFVTDPGADGGRPLRTPPASRVSATKVSANKVLLPLLDKVVQAKQPPDVIAEDVEARCSPPWSSTRSAGCSSNPSLSRRRASVTAARPCSATSAC